MNFLAWLRSRFVTIPSSPESIFEMDAHDDEFKAVKVVQNADMVAQDLLSDIQKMLDNYQSPLIPEHAQREFLEYVESVIVLQRLIVSSFMSSAETIDRQVEEMREIKIQLTKHEKWIRELEEDDEA